MSPPSLSGGSLLLAWQLKNKRVLVVGGGHVASARIESVLLADASITLVSPSADLHPFTTQLIHDHPDRILFQDRLFAPDDLLDIDMVLTALDDVQTSHEICALARARRIPINSADIPPSCDFYFGSQIRQGPLQIMISTNGQSPKLANIIKKQMEDNLAPYLGKAIENVGDLRLKLRARAPGVGGELSKKRMKWIVDVCTTWDMEDLARLNEAMINRLLDDGWANNVVPTFAEVGGSSRRILPFHLDIISTDSLLPLAVGFVVGGLLSTVAFLIRTRKVLS